MSGLKYVFRSLLRNWETSLLVVISLSAGLTAYVLINSRVAFHRSFDRHFANSENIYRVVSSTYTDGHLTISQPRTQRILGETLEQDYPSVRGAGFLCQAMSSHYSIGEQTFTNENAFHCSEGFIGMFSPGIIRGNTVDMLTRPNVVIISESFARKYFGRDNPVGQTIIQYPAQQFEIEAVFKDFPSNTHFNPEILISFHDNMHLPPPVKDDWGEFSFTTYLELDSKADLTELEEAINLLCGKKNEKLFLHSNSEYRFHLQPLKSIHTKSHLKNEIGKNVRDDYLDLLQLVSLFILIISGFNYVYFTFVRLSKNEVQYGLKRALGASNLSFLIPFLLESVLIHILALGISVLVLLMGQSLGLANNQFSMKDLVTGFWVGLMLIVVVSAIINPLILLRLFSRKSTLMLLSGSKGSSREGFSFKQLFTITQFAIIVFLISTILGIGGQLHFLEIREKGVDIKDKLVLRTPSHMRRTSRRVNNLDAFEGELAKIAGVRSVSTGNNTPGDTPAFSFSASAHKEDNGMKVALFIADSAYLEAFGVDIIAGRGFSRSGQGACVVNRTCMSQLGYKAADDVIGMTLYLNDDSGLQEVECKVIGVSEDFNFTSNKDLPDPIVLLDWTDEIMWGKYILAVQENIDEAWLLLQIRELFVETFPNYAFEYFWVEDAYNKHFEEEVSILKTLKGFGLITILLGVLSLLSMVRHLSRERTKEMAIRRVNGAHPLDVIYLLNMHFARWIAVAMAVGLPLSWIYLTDWLSSFAYKQSLSLWIFILAGAGAFCIGSLTVTLQSLRVARRNPVESITYE